jgi:hypothetical protein
MNTHFTSSRQETSEPPGSAVSQAWAKEMKDRAPEFRRVIEKGWRDAERDNLELWEQKTGFDSRDIQRKLDGMRRAGLVSFDTKYRHLIDSICDDTVMEENTAVRVDSEVDVLKSGISHRINAWCKLEIGDTHDWVATHQEEDVISRTTKSLSKSYSRASFGTLGNVPEEVESDDDTYKPTKVRSKIKEANRTSS